MIYSNGEIFDQARQYFPQRGKFFLANILAILVICFAFFCFIYYFYSSIAYVKIKLKLVSALI